MYAVIQTGGKQARVAEGDRVEVELLGQEPGSEVSFRPILLVDGETVTTKPTDLAGASVSGRIVELTKGKKIRGFTYKNKTNQRRRWGHRQHYALVEITGITRK
jgi:large subunit ribosomal protein L21